MPSWNPNATEFEVSINYDYTRGDIVRLPKPISKLLGKADTIKFTIIEFTLSGIACIY